MQCPFRRGRYERSSQTHEGGKDRLFPGPHLAGFVEPMGGGKRYDFTKIRIGLGGGSPSFRPTQQGTTSSTQNNPWQIAFLRERSRAVEAIAVKRLGMSEGKRALPQMLSQNHIFSLD